MMPAADPTVYVLNEDPYASSPHYRQSRHSSTPACCRGDFHAAYSNYRFRLNLTLWRFSLEDRRLIVHTCPRVDLDSTHSADIDYAELSPRLFALKVRSFYIALAGEQDSRQVLKIILKHLKPGHRIFVGVIAPIDPYTKAPVEVQVGSFGTGEFALVLRGRLISD